MTPDSAGVKKTGTLWVEDGEYVKPLEVTLGLTDGVDTEVQGSGLAENQQVILGLVLSSDLADSDPDNNPFAPKNPWRSRPKPSRRTNSP
jgi:HlyD family secretion protein